MRTNTQAGILSSNLLKTIAVLSMLVDHFGFVYFYKMPDETYLLLRSIGRLAFPIFCFLISEGVYHTKNRTRYCMRLFVFAIISEIPYDLLHGGLWNINTQNVMFTLLMGALTVISIDNVINKYSGVQMAASISLIFLCGCLISELLNFDYGYIGILYISLFFILRGRRFISAAAFVVSVFFVYSIKLRLEGVTGFNKILFFSAFAIFPIILYNGRKGTAGKIFQYAYYFFYPLHMAVLYILEKYFILF